MKWKILLILIISVAVYTILGALAFVAIEGPRDMERKAIALNRTEELKARYSHIASEDVEQLIGEIGDAYNKGQLITNSSSPTWTFAKALFFVGTVITTIGYGTIAPVTDFGRAFCVIYALFGIPLNFAFLAGLGSKMNAFTKRFDNLIQSRSRFPRIIIAVRAILTFLVGWVVFIMLPSFYLSWVEGWTYTDTVYFAFITLATIGFGDLAPGEDHAGRIDWNRLVIVTWVWLGLAWLSTIITTITECIAHTATTHEHHTQHHPSKPSDNKTASSKKPSSENTALVSHSSSGTPDGMKGATAYCSTEGS